MAARLGERLHRDAARLEPLVEEAEHVVPGHGAPMDGTRAAAILREDRTYLEALLADGEKAKLPIARNNGGQRKIHAENVAHFLVSLHDRDERLEQTILDAARERLAADRPALGRTQPPEAFAPAISATGLGPERAAALLLDSVMPSAIQIDHPRYLAFIPGAQAPASALADVLLAVNSIYGGSWLEGSGVVHAENEALSWLAGSRACPKAPAAASSRAARTATCRRCTRPAQRPRAAGRRATRVACSADVHSSVRTMLRVMDAEALDVPPAAGSPAPRCARRSTPTATACSPSSPPPAPPTSG